MSMQDISTAPRDGTWVWLYGDWLGEPHGHLAFWSDSDDGSGDEGWYDSECASKSLLGYGWAPTHWMPFEAPLPTTTWDGKTVTVLGV